MGCEPRRLHGRLQGSLPAPGSRSAPAAPAGWPGPATFPSCPRVPTESVIFPPAQVTLEVSQAGRWMAECRNRKWVMTRTVGEAESVTSQPE